MSFSHTHTYLLSSLLHTSTRHDMRIHGTGPPSQRSMRPPPFVAAYVSPDVPRRLDSEAILMIILIPASQPTPPRNSTGVSFQPFRVLRKVRYAPKPARRAPHPPLTYLSTQILENQRQQQQRQPPKRAIPPPVRPRSCTPRLVWAESLAPLAAVQVQQSLLPVEELLPRLATTTTTAWRCEENLRL